MANNNLKLEKDWKKYHNKVFCDKVEKILKRFNKYKSVKRNQRYSLVDLKDFDNLEIENQIYLYLYFYQFNFEDRKKENLWQFIDDYKLSSLVKGGDGNNSILSWFERKFKEEHIIEEKDIKYIDLLNVKRLITINKIRNIYTRWVNNAEETVLAFYNKENHFRKIKNTLIKQEKEEKKKRNIIIMRANNTAFIKNKANTKETNKYIKKIIKEIKRSIYKKNNYLYLKDYLNQELIKYIWLDGELKEDIKKVLSKIERLKKINNIINKVIKKSKKIYSYEKEYNKIDNNDDYSEAEKANLKEKIDELNKIVNDNIDLLTIDDKNFINNKITKYLKKVENVLTPYNSDKELKWIKEENLNSLLTYIKNIREVKNLLSRQNVASRSRRKLMAINITVNQKYKTIITYLSKDCQLHNIIFDKSVV